MYLIICLSLGMYWITTFITHDSEVIGVDITLGKYCWRVIIAVLLTIIIIWSEKYSNCLGWKMLGDQYGRIYIMLIGLIIFWKYFTIDFDLGAQNQEMFLRLLLLLSFCSVLYDFAFLLIFLLVAVQGLNAWEHHSMLILRSLKLNYSLCVVLVLLHFLGISYKTTTVSQTFTFLNFLVISIHYFKPGIDKIILGKSFMTWVFKNDTHHLIMSAYNWGWAKFIAEHRIIRFVKSIAPLVPALNFFVLISELSPILLLSVNSHFSIILICLFIVHFFIFIFTGINFWENMATLLLATCIFHIQYSKVFIYWGIIDSVIYSILIVVTIFVIKIWAPWQLAWWDTPFAGRVNWYILGVSGKKYRLSNRFMCPHERLYGHLHGYFLVEYGIIHGHPPGAVYNFELKSKIVATKGKRNELRDIQRTYGKFFYSKNLSDEHFDYLKVFFANYNLGKRKNLLPQILRWLKAPGGQFFYWGLYPEFNGQEKVRNIEIYYEEYYFTGKENLFLTNEILHIVEIMN